MITGQPATWKEGISLLADGKHIHLQDSIFILGLTLQNNFKWEKTIIALVSQLSQRISDLHALSKLASHATLCRVLQSLVHRKNQLHDSDIWAADQCPHPQSPVLHPSGS